MLNIWQTAVERTLNIVPVVSIVLLFIIPDASGIFCGLTLLILASSAWFLGMERDAISWYQASFWLTLGAIYAFWQGDAVLSLEQLLGLAAWYAMHSALLLLGLSILEQGITKIPLAFRTVQIAFTKIAPWLLALTVALLICGAWRLLFGASLEPQPQLWWFNSAIQHLAVGITLVLLSAWSSLQIYWNPQPEQQIYALTLWIALLLIYIRLLILGMGIFTPWDSAGLLGIAFITFLIYQFTSAKPWYYLSLLLPLLAIITAPWQLASTWCAAVLLSSGILYLSLASTMRQPWPLYLGILALNAAVYLWIPQWAQRYGLWQFYLLPAAVSLLIVLHLHRHELRPSLLHNGRLIALSLLYAGAGLDVFLRPELWMFILALALGLAGIILGLALHIRAFLYTGATFLILNILGQLRYFYPQLGMSRALILLLLGALITVGMVLFHLKREALLQQLRIIRADLAQWA